MYSLVYFLTKHHTSLVNTRFWKNITKSVPRIILGIVGLTIGAPLITIFTPNSTFWHVVTWSFLILVLRPLWMLLAWEIKNREID